MDEIQLLEAAERYIRGEMNPDEKALFEQFRKTHPESDILVVEHIHFLHQVNNYGELKNFKTGLENIHLSLLESGVIKEAAPKAKVIELIKRYSRLIAVAASISGFIALSVSSLIAYFTPATNTAYVEQLSRKVNKLEQKQNDLSKQIITEGIRKIPSNANIKSGGTSFMIDAKGLLVTNAHVIGGNTNVVVQNNKGQEFKATIVLINQETDLAILKIDDSDFRPLSSLPYGFKRSGADLGEQIFTLGYPRDEIVYGEGYMSAKTGFNGDTLACQIAVAANPGNSGGPVINKAGEVIGILSTRQVQAEGVVFAIKAGNIFKTLDELRQDTIYQHLKLSPGTAIRGLDRVQQIKKIEDCVFLVKTY